MTFLLACFVLQLYIFGAAFDSAPHLRAHLLRAPRPRLCRLQQPRRTARARDPTLGVDVEVGPRRHTTSHALVYLPAQPDELVVGHAQLVL